MKVLIIEDNADLAASICEFLEDEGWAVDWADTGPRAWEHTRLTDSYDALVVDLMLPGMDGLTLTRRLREERHDATPILMLTARDGLEDRLAGFKAGADDYLIKPFALPELQARLTALLRRGRRAAGELRVDGLVLDLDAGQARLNGCSLCMTPLRRRLLAALMRESPQAVSRQRLLRELWGDDQPDSDALRTHIHALRRSLHACGPGPALVTQPGLGYRLAPVSPSRR